MEETPKKTNREIVIERLKARYPEKTYSEDEEVYGQMNSDMDDYEKRIGEYKEREGKLIDTFSKDKRSARFLTDMVNGVDPLISVVERMGIDGITDLLTNPDKKADYEAANQRYLENLAKEDELRAQFEKNIDESLANVERIQKEKNLSDEVVDNVWDKLHKIAGNVTLGIISTEDFELALKAVTHDADVENARTEGNIAGRNAKIEERMRRAHADDGIPALGGANNMPRTPNRKRSVFDVAGDAR